MIRVRLQIGDGDILDTFAGWGFIYMDADERTEAPIKTREITSYAEEAGERTDPRTVQDAFDYKVKFLIECPNRNLENANAKIAIFNKSLYTSSYDSNIRTYKEVTFYNDYNRVKIVGLPEPIAQPTDFFRKQNGSALDCAQVELKIRVSDPAKCDFNMSLDESDIPGPPVNQDIFTDEFGISWYNKLLQGVGQVSAPLVMPDLASFSRDIDGQTIYYYSRDALLSILAQLRNLYNSDEIYDPIFLMSLGGSNTQSPPNFRTVWNINEDNTRAGVVVAYPAMGYYKNGVWQPYDTYFIGNDVGESFQIEEARVTDDKYYITDITDEDIAIPVKVLKIAEEFASTAVSASMLSNPMSLRKL